MKAPLADGTELNFPEGTDPSVVQAVARRVTQSRSTASGTPSGALNAPGVGGSPALPAPSAPEGMLNTDGSSSFGDRVGAGLAGVGIQAYLGLKQNFGKLTPEEMQVQQMSQSDIDNSGFAGKAANIAGNVGGGIAASMLTPAVAGPAALAKFMPYLKAALGSGAVAGLSTPVADQNNIAGSKLAEAAKAAALGPMVLGAGKGVAKVGTGLFKATQDAITLMKQGINPTLQQAAASPVGRWIGGLTSGMSDVRGRQEGELLDALTNRISNGQVAAPGATAAQRTGMINASLDQDYGSVLGGKNFPMTNSIRDNILRQGDNIGQSGGRFGSQVSDARGVLDNIVGSDRNATRMGTDKLRSNYLDPIQSAISDANDPKVTQALINAKNVVINQSRNSQLSPEELTAMQGVDSRFFDLMRLHEATKGGSANSPGVDISRLANSYGNAPGMDVMGATNATNEELIGPIVRSLGATPRQDESRTIMNTGRRMLGMGAGMGAASMLPATAALTAPLYAISALGQSAAGARALTGQTAVQQALKSALMSPQTKEASLANALRAIRDNMSNLGAGLTPGQ